MAEPRIPMPQALYDEFGKEVTDKVQDFVRQHVLAERERIAREWDGCMAPMFDPAGNPTDPLDIGATIRGAAGVRVPDPNQPGEPK